MVKFNDEKFQIGLVVGFIILGVVGFVWLTTYSPKGHYNAQGGSVLVEAQFAGSRIVVDGVTEYTTKKDSETYTVARLASKKYQFAVAHEGSWPWAKDLTPKPQTEINLKSFSIRTNPKIVALGENSEESKILKPKFNNLKVPTEKNKLTSKDGSVSVWSEFGTIFAEWLGSKEEAPRFFCLRETCDSRIIVVNSQSNIRSLDFLENRNDVIIFADDQGVYAIELDKSGIQNFQPIYRAPMPQFVLEKPRTMVIESRNSMWRLEF